MSLMGLRRHADLWLLGSAMLLCCVSPLKAEVKNSEHESHSNSNITGIPIVTFKWEHVETPYLVALWVLVSFLCKLGTYSRSGVSCRQHSWDSHIDQPAGFRVLASCLSEYHWNESVHQWNISIFGEIWKLYERFFNRKISVLFCDVWQCCWSPQHNLLLS